MDSNSQQPSFPALLQPSKPNSSTPTSVKPLHESIGSDFPSLEVKSQVMPSSRSAPSSPKRTQSYVKKSKTIEELRQELLILKGSNQSVELGQRRDAHVNASLTSVEKKSQSCRLLEGSVEQVINEAICIPNSQTERKLMLEDKSGRAAVTEVHTLSSTSHREDGKLMLSGGIDGSCDASSPRGNKVADEKCCNHVKKLPFKGLHDKKCEESTPYNTLASSDKDLASSSKSNPLDYPKLPPGNNQVCPLLYSNPHTLPPNTPKTNYSADLGPFPPLTYTNTLPTQPCSSTYPSQSQPVDSSKPTSPSKSSGTTWANLFQANRIKSNGLQLEYIQESSPSLKDRSPSISVTIDEVHEEINRWSNSLVGFVIGVKAPYKLMKQFVENKWKAFGHIDILVLRSGIFLFKFENEEMKVKVLEMGPWSYFDKPLMLKPWSPQCSYEKDEISTFPVWVRFPCLKLHLWSARILSKLSSQIGQPLFTDSMTATKQRLAYARVCVEISSAEELPQTIEILDHDGSTYVQPVEYEWIPKLCKVCKSANHGTSNCPKSVKMEWRPKTPRTNESKQHLQGSISVNSIATEIPQCSANEKNPSITHANQFAALEVLPSHQTVITSLSTNAELMCVVHGTEKVNGTSRKGLNDELTSADAMNETSREGLNEDLTLVEHMNSFLEAAPLQVDSPPPLLEAVDANSLMIEEGHTPKMGNTEDPQEEDNSPNPSSYEAENWEVMLSKSQRKKKGKMLHAIAHKEKALEAKRSARQSPK